jgi:tetratricopeptide (TPR) repeat protein
MQLRSFFVCAAVWLTMASCLLAVDTVKLLDGKTVAGNIETITATDVSVVAQPSKTTRKVPVNELEWVAFDGEPANLRDVRAAVKANKFEQSQKILARITVEESEKTSIKTEVSFYKALCLAQQAISGGGNKQTRAEAVTLLTSLGRNQADSFHYFDICELLGNVFIATGTPEKAMPLFEKIASAPWLEYQMRGHVLAGRSLLAQDKPEDAAKRFATAAALGNGGDSDRQLAAAKIGKAQVLTATGKQNQAIEQLLELLQKLPDDQAELHARAYNALGRAYEAADKKKEALLAYLHVPMLYASYPEHHAEALGRLSVLFLDVYKKSGEADKARKELVQLYPQSRWVAK